MAVSVTATDSCIMHTVATEIPDAVYMHHVLRPPILSAVSGTHKFDRGLSRLIHDELHWLDVPQRVVYKLGVMVFSCLRGQAPQYMSDFCQPVSGVASRQHLRSASRQLVVPALQAQHLRPKGICRGRSVGVELSA